MDWNECKIRRLAKEAKLDNNLINSLLDTSSNKLYSNDLLKLEESTSESKITLAYDALRETLEALAISRGFKIYNHECYCAFLKEILQETNLGEKFDDFRKVRNSINYYGRKITLNEAEEILKNMLELIQIIKNKYFSQ